MDSLININIDGIDKPILELLRYIEETIGWSISSLQPHKEALDIYMNSIKQRNDIPEELKAILIYNAKRDLKKLANQVESVKYGLSIIDGKPNTQNLNEEWLYSFIDGAGSAYQADLKLLWGKILKKQCESGSISKRLLMIIPQMDSQNAIAFTGLLSASMYFLTDDREKKYMPIIFSSNEEEGSPIRYDDYVELQSLGLIEFSFSPLGGYYETFPDGCSEIYYFDEIYTDLVVDNKLNVGSVILTRAGQELASIIETEKIPDYISNICMPYLKNPHKSLDDMMNE